MPGVGDVGDAASGDASAAVVGVGANVANDAVVSGGAVLGATTDVGAGTAPGVGVASIDMSMAGLGAVGASVGVGATGATGATGIHDAGTYGALVGP